MTNSKNEIQIFEYQGNQIAFDFGDGTQMINATQMAKAFGKVPHDFIRLESTKSFIQALKGDTGKTLIAENQIVRTVKGGLNQQGTWMCELLALKFAAWLNPHFEVWIYQKTRELLTTGSTTLNPLSGDQEHLQQLVRESIVQLGNRKLLADYIGINSNTLANVQKGLFKGKVSASMQHKIAEFCKRIISYDPEEERKAKRLAAEKEEVLYQLMILLAKENLSEEGKETIMQTYSFIKQSI